MQNFLMVIAYDGAKYKGWQRQENTAQTVQGRLEAALTALFGHKIEIHGSGRTDAGVHAAAQTAHFHANTALSPDEIKTYLNAHLPADLAVTDVKYVPERFHARLHVRQKTYRYRIWNCAVSNVFERKYVYPFPQPLDEKAMAQAAAYLLGTHDFLAFCSNKRMKKSSVRTVYAATVTRLGDEIDLVITANGFLYNMVRIIAGTLLEVGTGARRAEEMPEILSSRDRKNAGQLLPACGLILERVDYAPEALRL